MSSYSAIHQNNKRPLPRSPAQTSRNNHTQQQQQAPTTPISTAPTVYSFENQYNKGNNEELGGALLPDTPPGNNNIMLPYAMPQLKSSSPPRHRFDSPLMAAPTFSTTTSVVPSYHHHNHQPRSLPVSPSTSSRVPPSNNNRPVSPVVGSYRSHLDQYATAPPTATTTAASSREISREPEQQHQQPIPSSRSSLPAPAAHPTVAPTHSVTRTQFANESSLDNVLAESIANKRKAENTLSEYYRLEATHKEESRAWNEKLRSTQSTVSSLQTENHNLRRSTSEQADTIHKLRDQVTSLSRVKSTAEKFRTESGSLKEKLKEMEAKLKEQETLRSTLQRRLEEKERAATARHQDVNNIRGRLSDKEELVSSLSEAVRNRDASLAKLNVEYQAVASELGNEKQERVVEVAKLENVIAEGKEREMTLRKRVHDLEMELEATKRSRDEWHQQAEEGKLRCMEQTKHATQTLASLEETSRSFHEVFFSFMTDEHCMRFDSLMYDAKKERASQRSTLTRLLDESDRLMEDLEYAQKVAKSELGEKELLGSEVSEVCEISTQMMRTMELMTSSASWRRAMLETLIPDEIATMMNTVRRDVAEVVHRTNVISKRAMKKI